MMIRSTPPRSANFAEMPVPAPAPMIGCRAATLLRSRPSIVFRPMNGIRTPSVPRVDLKVDAYK